MKQSVKLLLLLFIICSSMGAIATPPIKSSNAATLYATNDQVKALIEHDNIRDTLFVINLLNYQFDRPFFLYAYDNTRLYTYKVVIGIHIGDYKVHVEGSQFPTKDTVPVGARLDLWLSPKDNCVDWDEIQKILHSKGKVENRTNGFDTFDFISSNDGVDEEIAGSYIMKSIGPRQKKCLGSMLITAFKHGYGLFEGRVKYPPGLL